MRPLWGIDLGGTKIEGVIVNSPEDPTVISRIRIPTEAAQGYDHIIGQIGKLVKMLEEESGLKATKIGMGTPGALDPNRQKMKNSNTTCLNDQPFLEDLQQRLKIEFKLANDANCFALAETMMGVVPEVKKNAETVFGVIMGTGVGGGVVVNRQVLYGRHGIAGEWGHNFLDESGGKCYCGRTGCVETILSGPALQRFYHKLSGQELSLKQIIERNEQKTDNNATLVVERMLMFFGKAMGVIINIIDPDVIVLGGGLGNIQLLYDQGVEEVNKYVFNHELNTIFARPQLGDSAGVFGAAMLYA